MQCPTFYLARACDGGAKGYGTVDSVWGGVCRYQNSFYCDTGNQVYLGIGPQLTEFNCNFCNDADGDGHNVIGSPVSPADDCNDFDASIYPGAPELCDAKDNDCDGEADEGLKWDMDGDGHYSPDSCPAGGRKIDDCDDDNPKVYPGALERCDGVDNDCDGKIDESMWEAWGGTPDEDLDGDGYFKRGCNPDCDDNNPAINPGALEICDGIDNNCNGEVDEGLNIDLDGDWAYSPDSCRVTLLGIAPDCNDSDPTVRPWAIDVCDGIDNNCDGRIDECCVDNDGDGGYDQAVGVYFVEREGRFTTCPQNDDCNDGDPTVYKGAPEICDGKDNDCNGDIDEGLPSWDNDGDGHYSQNSCKTPHDDCNDNPAEGGGSIYPGASETCNDNIDNNCNGEIDEGCCVASAEVCDGRDNDCDGNIDEDIPPVPCYNGPEGTLDVGICKAGTKTCLNGEWGICKDEVSPAAEICDQKDNDCNGQTDETCCDITVSVSPYEVAPQRTSGNTEATVYVTPIQVGNDCTVNLRVEPVPYSGGHDHHNEYGLRPYGTLDRTGVKFTAGDIQSKTAKYTSKEVAGTETIIATIEGSDKRREAAIDVRVSILGAMPGGQYWNLVGGTGVPSRHSNNHNAEASVIDAMQMIGWEYYNLTQEKLDINDMSLGWGGAFDLCNTWNPANVCTSYPDGGHSTHRIGTDVDVRSKNMTEKDKDKFKKIVCDNRGYPREHGTSRHWHIYFQLYRNADKKYCE